MEEFHPSHLNIGSEFRESIRHGIPTEHLNQAQAVFTRALEKHGYEAVTKENFKKVMETAQKDEAWKHTYSSGSKIVDAVKDYLKIKE